MCVYVCVCASRRSCKKVSVLVCVGVRVCVFVGVCVCVWPVLLWFGFGPWPPGLCNLESCAPRRPIISVYWLPVLAIVNMFLLVGILVICNSSQAASVFQLGPQRPPQSSPEPIFFELTENCNCGIG